MRHLIRPFRAWMIFVILFLVACAPAVSRDTATTSPLSTEPSSPLPTPGQTPSPTAIVEPTEGSPPTPTLPPAPTLVPTPIVTPIPTVTPPIIPEVVGRPQLPFWLYYWQGNEVWRVDDQGQNRELLLDTQQRLGQWLTAHPMAGSDCCPETSGPRVVASPDGQKLALVVVDKDRLTHKGEPFTFSIYVFDVASRNLSLVSEGVRPVWSPDSQRIAFGKERGLWIADLQNNQTSPLVIGDQSNPALYVDYWMWSPNGQRLAYRYSEPMSSKPEIWIINLASPSPPSVVPNIPSDVYYSCFFWMPDGQSLVCIAQDERRAESPLTLWTIAADTGERRQVARGFTFSTIQSSPNGRWLAFSALRAYEGAASDYDLWVASADGAQLLRITSSLPQDLGVYWSPDGTRLVFHREGLGVAILSLETGQVTSPGVNLPHDSRDNYAIGGLR